MALTEEESRIARIAHNHDIHAREQADAEKARKEQEWKKLGLGPKSIPTRITKAQVLQNGLG